MTSEAVMRASIRAAPRTTILRLENDELASPSPTALQHLARVLELPSSDLFLLAGIPVPSDRPSLPAMLRSDTTCHLRPSKRCSAASNELPANTEIFDRESTNSNPRKEEPMTIGKSTSTGPDDAPIGELIPSVRQLMPVRKLALYEHLLIAERQASRIHHLLGSTGPSADLSWVLRVENVQVVLQPRWKMSGISGMTAWDDGRRVIGVNKSHPQARRRFTLAHELKHMVDANRDKITYAYINAEHRELIANHFAACYLMPLLWLRKSWTAGLRDPEALAGLFGVSREAMDKRLNYLGFVDATPDRPLASYFRARTNSADLAA